MTDIEFDKTPGQAAGGSRWKISLRILGLLVALGVLLFLARRAGGYIPQFAEWVDELGFWGPLVFIVGYAIATVAFVPGSLLTLAAGAIFGLVQGTAYVFVAATLGSTAAFLVSRYLARAAIERRLADNARFSAIDRAVAREGRKIVLLLRLSPVFPFVLLNYGLGLTKVRLIDYVSPQSECSLAPFSMSATASWPEMWPPLPAEWRPSEIGSTTRPWCWDY